MIDLTADTVTPETLAQGTTAHDASGATIVGTLEAEKKWTITISAQVSDAQTVTLLTDSWIASHYNDQNLELEVNALDVLNVSTSSIFFICTKARNTLITSYAYQIGVRSGNNSTSYAISLNRAVSNPGNYSNRGTLGADSAGNVKIRIDANCMLASGNYEIIARYI